MKNIYLCVLMLLWVSCKGEVVPVEMANLLTIIDLRLQQPAPGFRVQILRISRDTFVDPPPEINSFESLAAFSLTFRPGKHKEALDAAIETARKAKWNLVRYPAYPRWCIKLIGPWNEVLGALAIDEDNSEVLVGGQWYKVEVAVIRGLTSRLLRSVLEAEAMSPTPASNTAVQDGKGT